MAQAFTVIGGPNDGKFMNRADVGGDYYLYNSARGNTIKRIAVFGRVITKTIRPKCVFIHKSLLLVNDPVKMVNRVGRPAVE